MTDFYSINWKCLDLLVETETEVYHEKDQWPAGYAITLLSATFKDSHDADFLLESEEIQEELIQLIELG